MSTIYDELSADQAMELSLVARLMYESRENRRMVLSAMNVSDEADLLDNIRTGAIAEHPAYEHYLAARILSDTQQAAREVMAGLVKEVNR